MVFMSQLLLIFSFLYVLLDPHKKINVGGELINTIFLLFQCETKFYMCFLTFVGSKTNSFKDNPWEGWTILCITSGIEN